MKTKKKIYSFGIFGISKFGKGVAEELAEAGMDILAVDKDPERVSSVADICTMAVVADVTDSKQLENLGLSDLDAAVVATTGDLSASVMSLMVLKEAGIPFVIAKASDEMQAKVFERLGADKVIIPEKEAAAKVAHTLLRHDFLDVFELSEDILLAEIGVPKDWAGKTLKNLDLRRRHGMNVAAVRMDGKLYVNWDIDKAIPKEATLVIIADRLAFDKMEKDMKH